MSGNMEYRDGWTKELLWFFEFLGAIEDEATKRRAIYILDHFTKEFRPNPYWLYEQDLIAENCCSWWGARAEGWPTGEWTKSVDDVENMYVFVSEEQARRMFTNGLSSRMGTTISNFRITEHIDMNGPPPAILDGEQS